MFVAAALSYVNVMPRLPLIEDLTTGPLPAGSPNQFKTLGDQVFYDTSDDVTFIVNWNHADNSHGDP